jgi:hypothetical protein
MKDLKNYILEGLFDTDAIDKMSNDLECEKISKFLIDNKIFCKDNYHKEPIKKYSYNNRIFKCDFDENYECIQLCLKYPLSKYFDKITCNTFVFNLRDRDDITAEWFPKQIVCKNRLYINAYGKVEGPFLWKTQDCEVNSILNKPIKDLELHTQRITIRDYFPKSFENIIFDFSDSRRNDNSVVFYMMDFDSYMFNDKLSAMVNKNFSVTLPDGKVKKIKNWKTIAAMFNNPKQYKEYYQDMMDNCFIPVDDIFKIMGYDITLKGKCRIEFKTNNVVLTFIQYNGKWIFSYGRQNK